MYHAYGLLAPKAAVPSFPELTKRLSAQLPGLKVAEAGGRVTVAAGDWEMYAQLVTGPEVQGESIGISEKVGLIDAGFDVAQCDRRVEVWSDSPDQFLEHLGDFQTVVEVLKSFPGVVAVDAKDHTLL